MKRIECQGKTIITTTAVAEAVAAFHAAAHRRGRTVRVEVPAVNDGPQHVPLILSPGETLTVFDCSMPPVELDAAPLIESLTSRQSAWLPRANTSA
ncbi:hypothetical protein SAMN06295879_0466 [Agreia bicolorata]|uniref:Uncharacterized protein n=1 Tax=Agreia bicolorata TaxID=110935 RepID=A0A1T4WZM8_9MICO|nr:hypothetical protein [Agreia bicolorata]SKA82328.1 hypothetical protein SAMN06295879_0466 [Agreia bicolorata]